MNSIPKDSKVIYAVNSYGRMKLPVSDLNEAYEYLTECNYYINNPPKYVQEVSTLNFKMSDLV